MADVFDLRWNDFGWNASKVFTSHRDRSSFCDVSLVSDDLKQHSAHKIILSACSEYFNTVLSSCDTPHTLVCMPGLSDEELAQMLDYIYKGEAQVQKDKIDRFLNNAQRFKLAGLLPKNDKNIQKEAEDLLEEEEEEAVPVHNVEDDCDRDDADNGIDIDMLDQVKESKDEEIVLNISSVSSFIDLQSTVTEEDNMEENESSTVKIKKRKRDSKRTETEPMIKVENGAYIEEYVQKNEDGTFSCKICGRIAKQRHVISNHVELHIEGLSYPCTFKDCDKVSKTKNAQRAHISTYHNKWKRGINATCNKLIWLTISHKTIF